MDSGPRKPAAQKKNNCFTCSVISLFGMIVCMFGVFVFALFRTPDVDNPPTLDVLEAARLTMAARQPTETLASRMVEIPTDTPEILPTFTRLPTLAVLPTDAPQLAPSLTPLPPNEEFTGRCTCHPPPDLNCTLQDFPNGQAQAQGCYQRCVSLGLGDIYGLDGDNDGAACEGL